MIKNKKLTIKQVQKDFEKRKYTAEELLAETIKTIETHDPEYHAYVSTTFEEARESLKSDDKLPLWGIPAALKDNFNWIGTKTTASSNILKNYLSPYNATVTQRLLDNSACIVGKTNMDAFAHGSSTETSDFFTTLNPFDMSRVAGGSSGGSATAVALNMSVYSIGSETAGSVRGPASWCGLVGFAPTFGRISRYGVIAMGSSLDRPGVMTNSVEDVAILHNILSGQDKYDATTIQEPPQDLTEHLEDYNKNLKIGLPRQYFDDRIDPEVLKNVLESIRLLEKQGAEIVEIDLLDPKYSIAVYTVVQRSEVSSNLARIDGIRYGHFSQENAESLLDQIALNRGEGFGHEAIQRSMTGAYTLSSGYYDAYYKKAQQVRTLIIRDFESAFKKVDVIMAPTMPTTAPKLGVTKDNPIFGELADVLTEPSALAGLPCISIPTGLDRNDLPIGTQIIGSQFDEKSVLATAYLFEKLLKN
jgi:aspartyl-tRNA(Asn)/glutamyl-tRNA(Gln) amidotransferase subunit A